MNQPPMTAPLQLKAADNARAVSDAALGVLRRIQTGDTDMDAAVDRLELQLRTASDDSVQGFADETQATEADLLATAASQLGIGLTALSAEAALGTSQETAAFESATQGLGRLADTLERPAETTGQRQGFDVGERAERGLVEAALDSLDQMTSAAATVVTAVVDKALKPLVSKVPDGIRSTVAEWDIPGRLARWGLRAIRRGFDLLSRFVDSDAVERMRAQLDDLLGRLGRGEDRTVLASWAIGADSVRSIPDTPRSNELRVSARRELSELAGKFGKLCDLLRRIAGVIVAIGSALAFLDVANTALITSTGLVLVLGAVLILGRDYTGATDLPGRVTGVRLILEGRVDERP